MVKGFRTKYDYEYHPLINKWVVFEIGYNLTSYYCDTELEAKRLVQKLNSPEDVNNAIIKTKYKIAEIEAELEHQKFKLQELQDDVAMNERRLEIQWARLRNQEKQRDEGKV